MRAAHIIVICNREEMGYGENASSLIFSFLFVLLAVAAPEFSLSYIIGLRVPW